MFTPEMIKQMVPAMLGMLKDPATGQVMNPISDIERFLTTWFIEKQKGIALQANEHRVVLFFVEAKGQLLMVPCTLDETDQDHPRVSRFLYEQAINVTQFATKLSLEDAVAVLMVPEPTQEKFYQKCLGMFRAAANFIECRIRVRQTPAPAEVSAYDHQMAAASGVAPVEADNDELEEVDLSEEEELHALLSTEEEE